MKVSATRAKTTRRTAANSNGKTPAQAKRASRSKAPPKAEPPEGEQITAPCLLIVRQPTDVPGKEDIQFMPMNGMDHLAIPTLLECALKISRENLGLPGKEK